MMGESLYMQFANSFLEAEQKEKNSGYYLINLIVPMRLLFELYNKFMNDKITPIEDLPTEQKLKYFNISKKYYNETKDQIKASKACYTLDLLTSNE